MASPSHQVPMDDAPPPYPPPPPSGYYYPPPPVPGPMAGASYPIQTYTPIPSQLSATVVVVSQPNMRLVQTFREMPVCTQCQYCKAEIVTHVRPKSGSLTCIICLFLILCGCFLGCCLIPFCFDDCKDVIHSCPNCHKEIARYYRI